MRDVDLSQFGQDTGGRGGRDATDEDGDEDPRGGGSQRVQCQNM